MITYLILTNEKNFFSNTIKLVLSTIVTAFFIVLFTTSNSYSIDCDASYPVTAAKPGQCDLTNSGSTSL